MNLALVIYRRQNVHKRKLMSTHGHAISVSGPNAFLVNQTSDLSVVTSRAAGTLARRPGGEIHGHQKTCSAVLENGALGKPVFGAVISRMGIGPDSAAASQTGAG